MPTAGSGPPSQGGPDRLCRSGDRDAVRELEGRLRLKTGVQNRDGIAVTIKLDEQVAIPLFNQTKCCTGLEQDRVFGSVEIGDRIGAGGVAAFGGANCPNGRVI